MKYFAIFAAVLGVAVAFPTSSVWSLQQLSEALENPNTDPQLIPFLEQALNKLMDSLFAGNDVHGIVVHFPDVIDVHPAPALPEVVPAPPASSGPLVQLIVNVNSMKEIAPVAPESPIYEDIIVGPAIVDQNPAINNPVDIINPVPAPVVDGDFGIIV